MLQEYENIQCYYEPHDIQNRKKIVVWDTLAHEKNSIPILEFIFYPFD